MREKWIRRALMTAMSCASWVLITLPVIAQPGLPTAPDQAPIDGGLSLLAVAGGAYAVHKLRKSRKD